jgi:hypothetical protein
MAKSRPVLLGLLVAVTVLGVVAGRLAAAEVAWVVALVVLLVALVPALTLQILAAVRVRKTYGRNFALEVSRSRRQQVFATLRQGEISADPYTRELAEREARRVAWIMPRSLSFPAVLIAASAVLASAPVDMVFRWLWVFMPLAWAALIIHQWVWWRRAKRYLAVLEASASDHVLR